MPIVHLKDLTAGSTPTYAKVGEGIIEIAPKSQFSMPSVSTLPLPMHRMTPELIPEQCYRFGGNTIDIAVLHEHGLGKTNDGRGDVLFQGPLEHPLHLAGILDVGR
jgi:hypothetical protein